MTANPILERRYRRLLLLYPAAFRERHEEEMIAILLSGSAPNQRHPRIGEVIDLASHGLGLRANAGRFPSIWERRHHRAMFPIRITIALWLGFLSAMLIDYQRGEYWLVIVIPAILANLYIAYRIRPNLQSQRR